VLATALVSRCRQILPMFRTLRYKLPDSQLGPVAAVRHLGLRLPVYLGRAIAIDHRHLLRFMAAIMSGSGPEGRSTL